MDLEGLELLSEQECRGLLRQARVGRVAISQGEVPAVFPVNYMVAGEEILFFTAEGTKLRAAVANKTVTFEVDLIDPFGEKGWSVMVAGRARERTEAAVIAGARRAGLRPWVGGDRFHLIAVAIDFVSGRRTRVAIDGPGRPGPPGGPMVGPHSPIGGLAQPPVRVGADWTLQAAADAMCQANVAAVLVGPDQAIVTEGDLTRALHAGLGGQDHLASICVTDLIHRDEDTTVLQAATDMLQHEIRHLLVRNWRGQITGIVSLRDVLGVLVDAMDPAVWVVMQQTLSIMTNSQVPSNVGRDPGRHQYSRQRTNGG
jgi:CBS domain-containing protein